MTLHSPLRVLVACLVATTLGLAYLGNHAEAAYVAPAAWVALGIIFILQLRPFISGKSSSADDANEEGLAAFVTCLRAIAIGVLLAALGSSLLSRTPEAMAQTTPLTWETALNHMALLLIVGYPAAALWQAGRMISRKERVWLKDLILLSIFVLMLLGGLVMHHSAQLLVQGKLGPSFYKVNFGLFGAYLLLFGLLAIVSLALRSIRTRESRAQGAALRKTLRMTLFLPRGLVLLALALLPLVCLRIFLAQLSHISGESHNSALKANDYILVAKYRYGWNRHSFAYSPDIIEGRLWGRSPDRGDIVLYRQQGEDFVSRVIGLPGDRIQLQLGVLYINGTRVTVGDVDGSSPLVDGVPVKGKRRLKDVLPSGRSYDVVIESRRPLASPDPLSVPPATIVVPEDKFFVLWDRRNAWTRGHLIPFDRLTGKVGLIFWREETTSP